LLYDLIKKYIDEKNIFTHTRVLLHLIDLFDLCHVDYCGNIIYRNLTWLKFVIGTIEQLSCEILMQQYSDNIFCNINPSDNILMLHVILLVTKGEKYDQ
jgi:hypothetical protein